MATIDLDALTAPISDDEPCGPDLEQDQVFTDLVLAAKGKEARESGKKGVVTPAEEPNWSDVADKAVGLFDDTKHLTAAVNLTRAATHLDGISGTADGLTLVLRLLESYWKDVYPKLDEDDGDAMIRLNTLLPLDAGGLLVKDVNEAILVSVKPLGEFSMRSIRLANGEIEAKETDSVPEAAHIDAAFTGADIEDLTASYEAVKAAAEASQQIESYLDSNVGSGTVPSFDNLRNALQAIGSVYAEQLSRRGVDTANDGDSDDADRSASPASVPGQINSRQDAVLALDRVSEFFRQNEPSSPVPLLLERAKRLIAKDFLEILEDLTPGGVKEARLLGGLDDD